MVNSYTKLPENYKQIREVDLQNNKKEFIFINIGSLVLMLPFFILYFYIEKSLGFEDGLKFPLILILSLVSMFIIIVLHELIHGLFFKVYGKGKLKFGFHGFAVSCAMPSNYFNKKAYTIIGLAPLVLITIITGVLSTIFYNTDYFLLAYIPLAVNFSGAIGDMYVVFLLLRCKKTVLVNDYGIGMKFYDIE